MSNASLAFLLAALLALCAAAPAQARPLTWSAPASVDPALVLNSVSCPSSSFCATVGYGDVGRFDGRRWRLSQNVDSSATSANGYAVSCASASFCAAVDDAGHALTFNGSAWTVPALIAPGIALASVSCASARFCVAVGGSDIVSFDGSTWSSPVHADGRGLRSVSCPTVSFCVAADDQGYGITYSHGFWSSPAEIDGHVKVTSVSCPSASFCAAVDQNGRAVTYVQGSWSRPTRINGVDELVSVSCASRAFCVAVGSDSGDFDSHAVSYDGRAWRRPVMLERPYTSSVSCVSGSFCAAVDQRGNAVIYNGRSWHQQAVSGGPPTAVSCAAPSFCAAVDSDGDGLIHRGMVWGPPTKLDPRLDPGSEGLVSVSCPVRTFCVAIGGGDAVVYNGRAWSQPRTIFAPRGFSANLTAVSCASPKFCLVVEGGYYITYKHGVWSSSHGTGFRGNPSSLSCVSASFCVAVGADGVNGPGVAQIYNGRGWRPRDETSPRAIVDPAGQLNAVACASASFCVAVGDRGWEVSFNGRRWDRLQRIDRGANLLSVSCPSTSFCVSGDRHGRVLTFDGRRWSAPIDLHTHSIISLSCASELFCAALDDQGDALTMGRG